MDLKSKLKTAKNIATETPISERVIPRQSVDTFVGNVSSLDEKVFGKELIYDDNSPAPYDAKAEMKMIKEIGVPTDKISLSKLPDAIKESIARNPLVLQPVDPKMDAFTAKLAAVQGVQKATSIINQLDEADQEKENMRKPLNEVVNAAPIDYSMIKTIVENAVKSLKSEIKNELNESISRVNRNNDSSLKVMKMSDKFLFLDSDNNIFECQMVYKGKNKTKKA